MYVADITSRTELNYLLGQAKDDLKHAVGASAIEQAKWDIEDIKERLAQVR